MTHRCTLFAMAAILLTAAGLHAQAPATADLHVTSTPPGAVVALNNRTQGNTPLTLDGLTPGVYLVRLTRRGHQDALRTVRLEAGQKAVVDLPLEPITGLVLIHSSPSQASVEIDGIDRGTTPLLLTDLPIGSYRVRIFKTGFLPKELALDVEDRTPRKLMTTLTSDSAILRIESEPPDADVSVNGIPRGTTPATVENVPEGTATVQVALDGYATFRQSVRLAAGQQEDLSVRLRPLPASLTIESIPPEARIYVDNQFKGTAPVTLADLDPGFYRVRAELPAHEPLPRTVELNRGQTLVEEFRLQANVGTLQVTTQPAGTQVLVDGRKAGITSAKPDKTDQVSEPFTVEMLEPGTHTIELVKTGYHTQSTTVTIERDKTTTRHFRLKRMFIPDTEVRTDTDVYRGVLLEVDPRGNVRLEIARGVFKTIPAEEIRSRRPLRLDRTTP